MQCNGMVAKQFHDYFMFRYTLFHDLLELVLLLLFLVHLFFPSFFSYDSVPISLVSGDVST